MVGKRIYYYDVLNVVSCISVIALHCNGYVHRFDTADQCWWLHVLYEVAFYNAVPIFFMLSGATLLGYHKKYDTRTFFRKRFRKAFLPFLFWSVVFFLFAAVFTHTEFTPGSVAYMILTCKIPFTNFWFFVPLFLLYLFMPFLSVMVSNLKNSQVLCLIVLIVGLQAIVRPVSMQVDVEWDLPMGSYVAYALLGYYLSRTSWEQNRRVIIAVALMALLFMSLRYILVLDSVYRKPVLWTYLSLYGYFGSVAIFLTVKRLCINYEGGGIVRFLSARSFGVYLLQRFFITCTVVLMCKVTGNKDYHHCGWMVVVMPAVVYCMCVAAVWVLQRFRFSRWAVPS